MPSKASDVQIGNTQVETANDPNAEVKRAKFSVELRAYYGPEEGMFI